MQVLLLLVLTVALYFGTAFAGELLEGRRISQQITSLNADIDRLKAQHQQLTAAVAEAKTDGFIERQARERLGLVKPGDVPVIVTNVPAQPAPPSPPPAAEPAHWQKWLRLFQPAAKL